MMTLLFILLACAMVTAVSGYKRLGIAFFSVTVLSAVFYFFNLMETSVGIQL